MQKYLGPAVVATRGRPIIFHVSNRLPNKHILPVDPTMMVGPNNMMVKDLPVNRIVTHLHGGHTPWISDGTPFQWFTPEGQTGVSFMNVPNTTPGAGTATYYFPNDQGARLAWYHDHAIGLTRLNAYAGIASAYVMTDGFENTLYTSGLLPDPVGIPLIVQDKTFVGADIYGQDPSWQWGKPGSLWYPHDYEVPPVPSFGPLPVWNNTFGDGRWDYGPVSVPPMLKAPRPMPVPASVVPEGFFDTTVINGAPYPYVNVPAQRVRFRILNASQARFYHLNFYFESTSTPGEADLSNPLNATNNKTIQIATEGGFLTQPVVLPNGTPLPIIDPYPVSSANSVGPFNLLLAPAERADIIVDFRNLSGSNIIMYNDAVAPFPMGDARNEYFLGDLDMTPFGGAPPTVAGFGPDTRNLMKIVVGPGGDVIPTESVLTQLQTALSNAYNSGEQPPLLYHGADGATPGPIPYTGKVNRRLTLNEDFDEWGRLIQRIGRTKTQRTNNQGLPTFALPYLAATTETPKAGATEVWEIYNLTGDTHPIHFHLVNVQVIQRAPFVLTPPATFTPDLLNARGPDPNETGWKETVRMNPGEVTTVIAQFNLPSTPFVVPTSPRTGGYEYVWHCHILEHEEHDMMRPLVVF